MISYSTNAVALHETLVRLGVVVGCEVARREQQACRVDGEHDGVAEQPGAAGDGEWHGSGRSERP